MSTPLVRVRLTMACTRTIVPPARRHPTERVDRSAPGGTGAIALVATNADGGRSAAFGIPLGFVSPESHR